MQIPHRDHTAGTHPDLAAGLVCNAGTGRGEKSETPSPDFGDHLSAPQPPAVTSPMLSTRVKIHEHPALPCSLQTLSVCTKWGSSTTVLPALSRAHLHGMQAGREMKPRAAPQSSAGSDLLRLHRGHRRSPLCAQAGSP